MKIVCAFDSFKGCMTAKEACHAAASGLQVPPATEASMLTTTYGVGDMILDAVERGCKGMLQWRTWHQP